MIRLGWCSDIHLDSCGPETRHDFAERCGDLTDELVITGDITCGNQLHLLHEFASICRKRIWFVLGNHDYWRSSFGDVASSVRLLCRDVPTLRWLSDCGPVAVGDIQLCGIDGWYDALAGDRFSAVVLNDWKLIADLKRWYRSSRVGPGDRLKAMFLQRAKDSAAEALAQLSLTSRDRVFFATHVPPYPEAAWHLGRQSEPSVLPYYSNVTLGVALSEWANAHPDVRITTLCGHSHSRGRYVPSANHVVLTAEAEYGQPRLAEVFEV